MMVSKFFVSVTAVIYLQEDALAELLLYRVALTQDVL